MRGDLEKLWLATSKGVISGCLKLWCKYLFKFSFDFFFHIFLKGILISHAAEMCFLSSLILVLLYSFLFYDNKHYLTKIIIFIKSYHYNKIIIMMICGIKYKWCDIKKISYLEWNEIITPQVLKILHILLSLHIKYKIFQNT